jgi:hypothetical protein
LRVATPDQHLVERPTRQKLRLLDRRPAGKLQFGTAALTHPGSPDGCLAAMPANVAVDHAPAIALPASVTLIALATKLLRISRKPRLDGHCPSLQAQSVEGNASVPVGSAVPWFTAFSSICFVMASISSRSVCDSQLQA